MLYHVCWVLYHALACVVPRMLGVVPCIKGGRVMIVFSVKYSTDRRFPPTFTNAKTTTILGAVANSLGKNSYFPLPLDVRRCVAPTGEEVDARKGE